MITDMLLSWVTATSVWFLGTLPGVDLDASKAGIEGVLTPMKFAVLGTGIWFPWAVITTAVPIVFAFWFAAFIGKIVKSLIPTIAT